jgi:hypothetical protein
VVYAIASAWPKARVHGWTAPTVVLEPVAKRTNRTGADLALSDGERVTGIEPALSVWEALLQSRRCVRGRPPGFAQRLP